MKQKITIAGTGREIICEKGENLLAVLQSYALAPDAPCGGRGKCGKCAVVVNGEKRLACLTTVDRDLQVALPGAEKARILSDAALPNPVPDGSCALALAYDIGTTTVVCYLMDGATGEELARASCMNPQAQFGADVISRIEYALNVNAALLSEVIRNTLNDLAQQVCGQAGRLCREVDALSIVGNTAMHHLLLEIDPKPLTVPPYMPLRREAMELPAGSVVTACPNARVRVLPNIAGFVGADTVGCMTATRFDRVEMLTLMIDIGTNGEMVLGDSRRRITCSTAAGPAFEGARIQCGMRGMEGAVDHVWQKDGKLCWSVIGGGTARGICGSGLLDLVAVLLELGEIDETGRMKNSQLYLEGTQVFLSQKDVREVQLAKAAIRAGIELMCKALEVRPEDIQQVYLAGAFGNYLEPASTCAIGMIPPVLQSRITPIGNAAGAGAKLCGVSRAEYAYSQTLAEGTRFLELASMPEFNDCYIDCLTFEEDGQ